MQRVCSILDSNFSDNGPLHELLVGFGSDGANVMIDTRNSVVSWLKQPHLVAFHCDCHLAALTANNPSKVLPNYLDDLTAHLVLFSEKSKTNVNF